MSDTDTVTDQNPLRVAIEVRAYEIWLHEGCPEGHDFDHWLQAEQEITGLVAAEADGLADPTKKKAKKEQPAT
ncbi:MULTISPECIES: DUF2934 domain-containing protein [Hyphomicrobiales]|uniref:DUF2934 domain-containing protein n=1 Tax=Agrobacterium pusense TaxID=648995 RepID=A0AA44EPT4_9HYPH|nr:MULTISPECIES: DUF2934 domain-containing protein [Hyphomicrobiales]KAB2737383.1 DUF2934 domain-containing protein [Brucella anthropi]NRF11352.1 DUF2934 domain-containing protein [Agrobacterium pusense]NRF22062.1 DUF2934 domain-containing protein [Agrobacterium pusense]CDN95850.1 hypothetical protein BN949_05022 [Agrobacterium tumefaciens]